MSRVAVVSTLLIAGLMTGAVIVAPAAVSAQSTPANVPATAAEAAPFLGDWTLTMQGPDRAASFDLTVKVEGEKVVGEIDFANGAYLMTGTAAKKAAAKP